MAYSAFGFSVDGIVASGLGRGAQFLAIDWVRRELHAKLSLDAFPGTLNLRIPEAVWSALHARRNEFVRIADPSAANCPGFAAPVRLSAHGQTTLGYLILPEMTMYKDVLEIIAGESLRQRLQVKDGETVHVEEATEPEAR